MNQLVATMDSKVHTVSSNLPMDNNNKVHTGDKMAMTSSDLPMDKRKEDMLRSRLESLGAPNHRAIRATTTLKIRGTMHMVR
jgi:hypothetical protein